MIGFMTALLVLLFQLSCPRDQRATDGQFQPTCILCRDGHKTQVWLCFLILSFLGTCIRADVSETEDLQTCLQELKGILEKSDAMLYTPSVNKIQENCNDMALECYMLELMMVIDEEEIEDPKADCFLHVYLKLQNKTKAAVQHVKYASCPACETYSTQNITTFMAELNRILEKMNSQAGLS